MIIIIGIKDDEVYSYFASELELTPKQSLFQVAQIGFVISKCELFDDTTIFFL